MLYDIIFSSAILHKNKKLLITQTYKKCFDKKLTKFMRNTLGGTQLWKVSTEFWNPNVGTYKTYTDFGQI